MLHLTCSAEDANRLLAIDGELRAVEVSNGVDIDFHRDKTFQQVFEEQVEKAPDAAAVRAASMPAMPPRVLLIR